MHFGKKKVQILLFLILFSAFLIRIWGVSWGLPYGFHPDEVSDKSLRTGRAFLATGSLNPENFFEYPSLQIYTLLGVYGILYKVGFINLDLKPETMSNISQNNRRFDFTAGFLFLTQPPEIASILIVIGRTITVIMGVMTIFLVYKIGRNLYDEKVGLLASAFLAFTMLHVLNSTWTTVDVPLTMWACFAFFMFTRVLEYGKFKDYIFSGAFIGLAIGTKYNGLLLFLPLLVAHILYLNKNKDFKLLSKKLFFLFFSKKILLTVLTAFLVFTLTTPYWLLSFREFKNDFSRMILLTKVGHWGDEETLPGLILNSISLMYGLGLPLFLISIFSLCFVLLKHTNSDILLLSWFIPLYLILGTWAAKYGRYLVPLLPFIMIFMSYFIITVYDKFKIHAKKRIIVILICAFVLIYSIVYSLIYVNYASGEDTRTTARNWIIENFSNETEFATNFYVPPIHNETINYIVIKGDAFPKYLRARKTFPVEYDIYNGLMNGTTYSFIWNEKFDPNPYDKHFEPLNYSDIKPKNIKSRSYYFVLIKEFKKELNTFESKIIKSIKGYGCNFIEEWVQPDILIYKRVWI